MITITSKILQDAYDEQTRTAQASSDHIDKCSRCDLGYDCGRRQELDSEHSSATASYSKYLQELELLSEPGRSVVRSEHQAYLESVAAFKRLSGTSSAYTTTLSQGHTAKE